jgi:outer membrane protein assembly factor BamB
MACAASVTAQPGRLRILDAANRSGLGRVELSPPQVPLVSGTTAARLEQVPALVADANWDDAIDTLIDLSRAEPDRVVAVDGNRYLGLREYCHRQIARWPADGLTRYRQRVDGQAERWYRVGLAARNNEALGRVVDEAFCSSWGDDALFALGELALERADYAAARRYLEQITPLLRDPAGWLTYPASNIDAAAVHARLVLTSIRAGEWDRAQMELDMFRRLHPQASGPFAGRVGLILAELQRLLAMARDWPEAPPSVAWQTFGGSNSRNHIAAAIGPVNGPAWRDAVRLTGVIQAAYQTLSIVDGRPQLSTIGGSQPALSHYPIAAEGLVYFTDGARVYAAAISDGSPAITSDGVVYRDERPAEIGGRGGAERSWQHGVPRHTLTLIDHILYVRSGSPVTSYAQAEAVAGSDVVGLDLSREGLLALRAQRDERQWSFDGVPVGDGRNLYVAMRRSDVDPQAAVACFDATSGRQRWRTTIGSANTPAGGRGDEITHNLVTPVGDRVFFNSNLGLIASLRTRDGAIVWLHRYERSPHGRIESGRPSDEFARDPSPAVYHQGRLIVAPSDTSRAFALDAETGAAIWSTEDLAGACHLLGVVDGVLIAGGDRLHGVDAATGKIRFTWPEQGTSTNRGQGRGVIAGLEVFWPTAKEIHVLDAITGRPTRTQISLAPIGEKGANLAAADGYLIAAGPERMMAYGSQRVEGSGVRVQNPDP